MHKYIAGAAWTWVLKQAFGPDLRRLAAAALRRVTRSAAFRRAAVRAVQRADRIELPEESPEK